MKQVVRLNESQLKRVVAESVKRVLNEGMQNWFERPASSVPPNQDLIQWIRNNAENYVTADFNTDDFIRSLIKFLG